MNPVRSLFFYVMLFVSTIILGLLAILASLVSRGSNWSHLVARLWGNVNLWTAGVKVEVHGLENIDPEAPYVYAANHQSWFDIFAILGKLLTQFRWLAKEELFHIFILGPAMKATGYISIDRSDRHKAFESLNRAAERVKSGTSVVIFPEGTRSMDGVLKEFKKGGFILSIKSQQPMVPISISGSHKVLPKRGSWILHPGPICMTIGAPIPTEGYGTRDRDTLMAQLREAIALHLTPEEGGPGPRDTDSLLQPASRCKGR